MTARGEGDLSGVRVLLVDDDDDGREMIAMVLQDRGAIVTQARSSSEALEAFVAAAPDVLVSDIGLPIEDGFGLLRKIREVEATRGGEVPAVALTGYGRVPETESERARGGGFAVHLMKPVAVAQLLRALTDVLEVPPVPRD